MLDATEKVVEGSKNAGIYTNESGAYGVIWQGDRVGLFGSDISSARKVLEDKKRG